jgi:hypothetical protein
MTTTDRKMTEGDVAIAGGLLKALGSLAIRNIQLHPDNARRLLLERAGELRRVLTKLELHLEVSE